jgi:hypothetical protein
MICRYAGPVLREGDIPSCQVVIDVSTAEGAKSLVPRLTTQVNPLSLPSFSALAITLPLSSVFSQC